MSTKKLSVYDIDNLNNTTPLESNIFSTIAKYISDRHNNCEDYFNNFFNDETYLNKDFTIAVPFTDGTEFILTGRYDKIEIYKVFPVGEDPEKVDIREVDFSGNFSKYSDCTEQFPYRESKDSLLEKLKNKSYIPTEYSCKFEINVIDGRFCEVSIGSDERSKYYIMKPMFMEFLEAIGEFELIFHLSEFIDSYRIKEFDLVELGIALRQTNKILEEHNLTTWNDFNYNDLDNSAYLFAKKGDYNCIFLDDQNSMFVVLFKDINDYIVYQVGNDLRKSSYYLEDYVEEDFFQNIHSRHFHDPCTLYTNENSYDFRLSLEFIEESEIEDILSKECFMLKVKDGKSIVKQGLMRNFYFNVSAAQSILAYEYKEDLEVANEYDGSVSMLYADSFLRHPTLYEDMKNLRYYLIMCNGNNYSWNKNGSLVNNSEKLKITSNEARNIFIPEGDAMRYFSLDEDANLFTFPDNISEDWLEEIKNTISDIYESSKTNDDAKIALSQIIDKLHERDIVCDFINSLDG